MGILQFLVQWVAINHHSLKNDQFHPYSQSPRNHWNLLSNLQQIQDEELEEFIPQLCNILIDRENEIDYGLFQNFERIITDKCASCLPLGMRICGVLKASTTGGSESLFSHVLSKSNNLRDERLRHLQDLVESATAHGYNLPQRISFLRSLYYRDFQFMLETMTRIGTELKQSPVNNRNLHLRDALSQFNSLLYHRMLSKGNLQPDSLLQQDFNILTPQQVMSSMPSAAAFSLNLPIQRCDEQILRILRIVESECEVLPSKERCPYLLVVEVLQEPNTVKSEELFTSGHVVGATIEDVLLGRKLPAVTPGSIAAREARVGAIAMREETLFSDTPDKGLSVEDDLDTDAVRNDVPLMLPEGSRLGSKIGRIQGTPEMELICESVTNLGSDGFEASDSGLHNTNSPIIPESEKEQSFEAAPENSGGSLKAAAVAAAIVEGDSPKDSSNILLFARDVRSQRAPTPSTHLPSGLTEGPLPIPIFREGVMDVRNILGSSRLSPSSTPVENTILENVARDTNSIEGYNAYSAGQHNMNHNQNIQETSTISPVVIDQSSSPAAPSSMGASDRSPPQLSRQPVAVTAATASASNPPHTSIPPPGRPVSSNVAMEGALGTRAGSKTGDYGHGYGSYNRYDSAPTESSAPPAWDAYSYGSGTGVPQVSSSPFPPPLILESSSYLDVPSSCTSGTSPNAGATPAYQGYSSSQGYSQPYSNTERYARSFEASSLSRPSYTSSSGLGDAYYQDPYQGHYTPSITNTDNNLNYNDQTMRRRPGIPRQPWREKKDMIRRSSPFGNLPGWDLKAVIVKSGDDLRKEVLAMQLVRLFKQIFELEGLDIYLHPYHIVSTDRNAGFVEFIEGAQSIDRIKKSLPDSPFLKAYFEETFGASYSPVFTKAMQNFVKSLAGYSLVTYILQVKDRHNANILIEPDGHMVHIDYGFILGDSPGFNINFENAPFKLTKEYVDLLGGLDSAAFRAFEDLFVRGFFILQKHHEAVCSLIELFYGPRRRGAADAIRSRLLFPTSQADILELIRDSYDSWRTKQYDWFQQRSNNIMM